MSYIICAVPESSIKKVVGCANNQEKSLTKEQVNMFLVEVNCEDKNYWKVRDHCYLACKYRCAAHSICNLRFNVLNKIPVVFHYRSNYDYNFTVKELANKFKGQFECFGENTEKCNTFSVSLEKSVDSLAEGIHKIKYEDCDCFLESRIDFMKYKFVFCNKVYSKKIDEELKKAIQEHN